MSENKHTPGPWSVGNPPDGTRGYVYCGDVTGSAVAQVKFSQVHRSEQETDANARLIAAAPELLEALEEFTNAISRRHIGRMPQDVEAAMSKARAAAAKALGR